MARLPRLNIPNIPQHVVQRGNNRQVCFFQKQDYTVYLNKLKEYSQQFRVSVHAYVLMTNHVHLLMTPQEADGVSQLMQALGRYFVRYINRGHGRTGTLWEGRFKSSLVDSQQYFLTVSRYIELNPVRAGMVSHPAKYPWSSFRGNALNKRISLLKPHDIYKSLGKDNTERKAAYLALFENMIEEFTLQEIREAINKRLVLGDDKFKAQIANQCGRALSYHHHGGDRKSEIFRNSKIK